MLFSINSSVWLVCARTHRRRRLCKVEVSIQKHSDVVLAGLQGNGQGSAAILRERSQGNVTSPQTSDLSKRKEKNGGGGREKKQHKLENETSNLHSRCRSEWHHSPARTATDARCPRDRARRRTWAPWSRHRRGCWPAPRRKAERAPCRPGRGWLLASAPSVRPKKNPRISVTSELTSALTLCHSDHIVFKKKSKKKIFFSDAASLQVQWRSCNSRGRTWLALALTSPVRSSCRTVWKSPSEWKAARAVSMMAV